MWTATELRTPREHAFAVHVRESRFGQSVLLTLAMLVFVTMLSGGFVAGLDAGKIFNTFPLMEAA
jgi:cytochrome c oxidase assembly protein subunit 15